MSALNLFTDFFAQTTGPAYLTSPDQVINDAQMRNYEMLELLFASKKDVQGGSTIKDMIFFDDPNTAQTYLPGATATVNNVQGGSTISVPWRFVRVPIPWTEAEILLNEGGGGGDSQFHQFKKLKEFKYQQAFTSLMNKLERLFVATASASAMEGSNGSEPYSIMASVTSDGMAPAGFTTVQGQNPTTQSKWRNQIYSFTAASPLDANVGIISGMDTMSQLVTFKKPPSAEKYFTDSAFKSQKIYTNREGRRLYMRALRANNDITRAGPQDAAYADPVFNAIPVRAAESLDDAGTFNAGYPGFLFLNMDFMKLIFHKAKFMQKSDPMMFADKPDTRVVWIDTYLNLFCQSRQRQGYLSAA